MALHIRVHNLIVAVLLVSAATPALACLNDRDTARTEQLHALSIQDDTAGTNNAARILTGRFERNPAVYYRTRIARLQPWLEKNPDDIDAYDDIAVAFDRIGDDTSAIRWIETKRTQLEAKSGKQTLNMPGELQNRWYRYYANIGTFRVHQWIRAGAAPTQIDAVQMGRDEIEKALLLNSNAHYGRERVQLLVMKWIIDMEALKATKGQRAVTYPLAYYLEGRKDPRLANGLVGLIELGGAWESIDVYDAIATLWRNKRPGVALFAAERVRELLAAGRHSLFAADLPDSHFVENARYVESKLSVRPRTAGLSKFRELRAEAEQWNRNRAAYMEARIAHGEHPDTNASFWSGWHEPQPPSLELTFGEQLIYTLLRPWVKWPLTWLACSLIAITAWRRLRRRGASPRTGEGRAVL